jgi:hypothetical protein
MAMRPAQTEDAQTELATTRTRLRDPEQRELDADVAKLIAEWDAAGQPETGDPNRRYETNDPAESKRRVRRAFTLANKGRKDADPPVTPVALAPYWWKDGAKDADGFLPIKFGVRESVASDDTESAKDESETPKTDSDATDPNADAVGDSQPGEGDQAPFDQGSGDQEGDQPSPRSFRGRRK